MKESGSGRVSVLRKPMALIKARWPRTMSREDMRLIHLVQMKIKEWAMNTGFEIGDVENKDFTKEELEDLLDKIKTRYVIPIGEIGSAISVSPASLTKKLKNDDGGDLIKSGHPIRRIDRYCDSVTSIRLEVSMKDLSGYVVPISTALYCHSEKTITLETTQAMGFSLLAKAKKDNASFVDMQLQMSLKSMTACHILDRISRFKGTDDRYTCSIKNLIEECGLGDCENDIIGSKERDRFLQVNLRQPINQIVSNSDGMWSKSSAAGFKITSKTRGQLSMRDMITFDMKYTPPTMPKFKRDLSGLNASMVTALKDLEKKVIADKDQDDCLMYKSMIQMLKVPPHPLAKEIAIETLGSDQ